MEQTRETFSNRVKVGIVAVCSVLLIAAGALAYFTDTKTVSNPFSVSNALTIDVTEANWDPANGENITPQQVIAKDPVISNDAESGVSAWMVAEVKVPVATVNGTANTPLFTLNNIGDGWTAIGTPSVVDGKMVYTYGYATEVAADGKTSALFESVTFANPTDAELETLAGEDFTIDVIGYGIQSDNTGFASAEAAWTDYKTQA